MGRDYHGKGEMSIDNSRPKVIFLSNGFGEDEVGGAIAEKLSSLSSDWEIVAFPLVGEGKAYLKKGIPIVGYFSKMPSFGIINNNLLALFSDISHGLISTTWKQLKSLRILAHSALFIVAIGDRVPLFMGALTGKPLIFVGIAQSVKVHSYSFLERWVMKKFALEVFTRDIETCEFLLKHKIKASFVGNPILNLVSYKREPNSRCIGLLPGSRKEFSYNLKMIFKIVEEIWKRNAIVEFILSLSPNVSLEELMEVATSDNWQVFGKYKLRKGDIEVKLTEGIKLILAKASVVIGLAGTANEQAAGAGIPVISFRALKRQVTKSFIKHQKRLLDKVLILLPPYPTIIAEKCLDILNDKFFLEDIARRANILWGQRETIAEIANRLIAKGRCFEN